MKIYCNVCNKHRKLKNPKISYIQKKALDLRIVYGKCGNEYEKIFKDDDSIEILKILDLITNIEEYENISKYIIMSEEIVSQ